MQGSDIRWLGVGWNRYVERGNVMECRGEEGKRKDALDKYARAIEVSKRLDTLGNYVVHLSLYSFPIAARGA